MASLFNTINDKLLNTNKHIFLSALLNVHSLTATLLVFSLQSQIKTQLQKTVFFPLLPNSEDGRNVLTSTAFPSASCCELNRCEESTLFPQQEAVSAEESQPETTDRGGETSDLPAASFHCSQSNTYLQKVIPYFQRNSNTYSLYSCLGLMMMNLPEPIHTCRPEDLCKHFKITQIQVSILILVKTHAH